MAWIDEVRPHLERLHLAAPSFQGRQDHQGDRRLANTAMSTGDDQSWESHLVVHALVCELDAAVHRPDRRAKVEDFLIFFVQEIIDTSEDLPVIRNVIGR